MIDQFPKGFDPHQHGLLRKLYGDLVPPIQKIAVRLGLYGIVDRLFAELGRLQPRRNLRVLRIETRSAGYLEIVTTGGASLGQEMSSSTSKRQHVIHASTAASRLE